MKGKESVVRCANAISRPEWILKKTGMYPQKDVTQLITIKLIINFIIHVAAYANLVNNIAKAVQTQNTTLLNWIICVMFPTTNYYVKISALILQRKTFFSILDHLESEEFNPANRKLNKNIQQVDDVSRILTKYFAISMGCCVMLFSYLPIFLNSLMIIPASYNTGQYDILYRIIHCICTSCIAYNCFGVDMLYITLLALCGAQLRILQEKILNISQEIRRSCRRSSFTSIYLVEYYTLRKCIINHNKINRFVKEVGNMLSLPMLVQYLTGCLMICYSLLELIIRREGNLTKSIGFGGFIFYLSAIMTVYNWLGNEIMYKSEKIIEACFLCKWYNLNVQTQKILLVLMERCKRPLVIRMYGLIFLSLESLGMVIRWSYSVFALVKAGYS